VRIEVRFNDDVAVISLSGKFLAGSDGPYMRQKVKDLIEAGTKMLVVDLAQVPVIDSTGLGFLAGSRVTTQNAGVRMVLSGLKPQVQKVLDQLKLAQIFVIAADEAAAVKRVQELSPPPQVTEPASSRDPKGRKPSTGPAK